jgi:hypothetical protein
MVTPPLAKFAPLANQILLHLSPTFPIKIDLGESSLFSDFLSRLNGRQPGFPKRLVKVLDREKTSW